MADSSVTTTFFANERDAQAAIVRLEKKYADLEAKIKNVGKASRESSGDGASGLDHWVGRLAMAATGYMSISRAIGYVVDMNKEMLNQADEAALKYNRLFTRFQVQSGFGAKRSATAKKQILGQAVRAAVPVEYAETLAEELAGEGFSPDEATGASLKTMLDTVRATGMGEVDPRQLAKAAAMFLSAQGKAKTDANLRPIMVAIQRLFKETSLKLEDLVDLSGKTEVAAGSLTTPETLAMFDIIRQKNPADVASTAFKIIIDRLQTIRARPHDALMLARIGVKPEDVDLVGEDIQTVLDRLATGLDKVSPEIQNMVLSGLFEERARAPAQGLIRDRKKFPELLAKMRNVPGFEADVAIATGGKASGRERFKAMEEMRDAARDTGTVDLFNAAETLAAERGQGYITRKLNRLAAELWRYAGASDDVALFEGFGGAGGLSREEIHARRSEMESGGLREQNRLIEANNKLLEEIAENTRKTPRREGAGAP